jgi:hypothetical protein
LGRRLGGPKIWPGPSGEKMKLLPLPEIEQRYLDLSSRSPVWSRTEGLLYASDLRTRDMLHVMTTCNEVALQSLKMARAFYGHLL